MNPINVTNRLVQRVVVGMLCGGCAVGPVVAMVIGWLAPGWIRTYQGAHDVMLWCCLLCAFVVTGLGVADLGRELNRPKAADVARRSSNNG